jgi:protein SCO1/2
MMPSRNHVLACALLIGLSAGAADAHDPQHHRGHATHPPPQSSPPQTTTTVKLRDHDVIGQDGKSLKFAREAVANRIVVISFIYTSCTTVCPVLSGIVANVQDLLGDAPGDDVALISISTDPVTDTPSRLRAYAQRFDAKPGWLWLTGEKRNVDQVLRDLGAYSPDIRNHNPVTLVGDARRGEWTRFYGMPEPSAIMARLAELRRARQLAQVPQGG